MQASLEAKLNEAGVVLHAQISDAELAEKKDHLQFYHVVILDHDIADLVQTFADWILEQRVDRGLGAQDPIYALGLTDVDTVNPRIGFVM